MNRAVLLSFVIVSAAIVLPSFGASTVGAQTGPSIAILSPAANAEVSSLGVRMVVDVEGFILDQENFGGASVAGHGHIHYFVDGSYVGATWLTVFDFGTLAPGPHTLRAQLFNNDHTALVPEVSDAVTVTAGTPEIRILEPVEGAMVSSLGFRLRVAVSNFTFDPLDFGGANVPGEGHYHVLEIVGGQEVYKTASANPILTLTGFSVGVHRLKVGLYNNNHSELASEYSDQANITVTVPSISASAPPTIAAGQALTITWTVDGFLLDPGAFGGTPEPGRGHVHVFEVVDGQETYKGATAGTSFTLTGLSAGRHTLKVELYNNDHSDLTAEYSDTLIVDVGGATTAPSGVSPAVLYGSVGVLVAIVAVLLAILLRMRGRKQKTE